MLLCGTASYIPRFELTCLLASVGDAWDEIPIAHALQLELELLYLECCGSQAQEYPGKT